MLSIALSYVKELPTMFIDCKRLVLLTSLRMSFLLFTPFLRDQNILIAFGIYANLGSFYFALSKYFEAYLSGSV